MKQEVQSYRFDSGLYSDVSINFEIVVDGHVVLHELHKALFCQDIYEIQLDISRLNEGK